MMYSINLMFISMLTLSTIITISSPSWFCMWIGVEMNTMAFIPLMYNSSNKLPTESSLKYFLIQTFASLIMMTTIIIMMNKFYMMITPSNMMTLSMGIKSGAAPFHMWYPSVIEGLSWIQNSILMTWQKIAPLTIMSMLQSNTLMLFMVASSMIIGPINAFNQSSLRKIMAYSSITHISWMIISMYNKSSNWATYMIIYFTTSIITIMLLWSYNSYYLPQLNNLNIKQTFILTINLLSMGGFPPLLGFTAKWIILNELINMNMILISMMLVLSSCLNLYIYTRILHPSIHLSTSSPKIHMNTPSNSLLMLHLTTISMTMLIIIPLI